MKKIYLFVTLWLVTLTLAGCNQNCNCENPTNENEALDNAIKYCNDHWGTHSYIHSPTAAYGECAFPSGVTCEDTILWTEECNYEPNLENIDTEEKRLAECTETVEWWMDNLVTWAENIDIEWWDESEGWASFVRNGVIKYTKDWNDFEMNIECVADFVDGSVSISYDDEVNVKNSETND